MSAFLQQLLYGLSVGSTYVLIALGITLVYRGMDLINFAQGEIFMAGAFMGYVFHVDLALPIWLALPCAMASGLLLGAVLERVFLRRIENASPLTLFMMTVALFILLRSAAQLIFGASAYRFPPFSERVIEIGGVQIGMQYLLIIGVSLVMMAVLYWLLTKTKIGLSARAVAQDQTAARMMGINVSRVNCFIYALSALLGTVAGIVYAPVAVLSFDMGNLIMLKGFTAALLGGLGLISGAVFGGYALGIIEQFGTLALSSAYKDMVSFSILLLIILLKPNGILGKKVVKKV
ncbi:branched-chain amino acid ABC transporter permease [Achromobacter sp. CSND-B12]|uniref:branched-chain amino acid ABC transporter permease n=1 Tax=Achromobacter sp. CSND-B12 TaxID=3462570 RepID=UPI00406A2B11